MKGLIIIILLTLGYTSNVNAFVDTEINVIHVDERKPKSCAALAKSFKRKGTLKKRIRKAKKQHKKIRCNRF